jgi:4-hydroxybenzoate polyprenyltransferase
MNSLWHFFRLIRPLNLAVIALTMAVFQIYVAQGGFREALKPEFLILVFSTLLIAAAGNIINDYFDVKADRVNKPELLIIDKHIKRRWAIIFNWVFNSVGLLIAMYLGWKYDNWFMTIIPFVTINLLWFYSMYFKRTLILGNIIVAFLTGIVPLYILLYNNYISIFDYRGIIVLFFALYAFWLNLIREIVKDMADIKGDLLLNSKSMPIVFGIGKTKIVLILLYIIAVVPLSYFLYQSFFYFSADGMMFGFKISIYLLALTLLAILASFVVLPNYMNRSRFLMSSNLLKLAMFFGLLIPLFLY